MTIAEVKKGLLLKMQEAFPKETYKYYAMEVKEGFTRPSFFTQLKPVSMEPCNYNSRSSQAAFYITYFQKTIDEAEALDVIQKLRDLFGLYVKIGDRAVKILDYDYEFSGKEKNIAEITVDIEWMDCIPHENNAPVMERMQISRKVVSNKL